VLSVAAHPTETMLASGALQNDRQVKIWEHQCLGESPIDSQANEIQKKEESGSSASDEKTASVSEVKRASDTIVDAMPPKKTKVALHVH
jgi:hypothetical protein